VPQSDVARVRGPRGGAPAPLTLYIEGARDRSILRAWAYRFMPARARDLLREVLQLDHSCAVQCLECCFRFNPVVDIICITCNHASAVIQVVP